MSSVADAVYAPSRAKMKVSAKCLIQYFVFVCYKYMHRKSRIQIIRINTAFVTA